MVSQMRTKDLGQLGQTRFMPIQYLLFDEIFITGNFDKNLVKDVFLLFLRQAKVLSQETLFH